MDSQGDVIVVDFAHSCLRRMGRDGSVVTIAGTPGKRGHRDGSALEAQFTAIFGMTVGMDGTVYVVDYHSGSVLRCLCGDEVITLGCRVGDPIGLGMDSKGTIYAADCRNYRIVKVAADGRVATFAGCGTKGVRDGLALKEAQFVYPRQVFVDGEDVYVADANFIRVVSSGMVSTVVVQQSEVLSVVKAGDGHLYWVCQSSCFLHRLVGFQVQTFSGFTTPTHLAVDPMGIWIADGVEIKRIYMCTNWSPSLHSRVCRSSQREIRTVMLLRLKDTQIRRLPRDLVLWLCRLVAIES